MTRGRPLRFLVMVLGGWIGARAALLWPEVERARDVIRSIVPIAAAPVAPADETPARILAKASGTAGRLVPVERARRADIDEQRRILALYGLIHYGAAEPVDAEPWRFGTPPLPVPPRAASTSPASPSRWSASVWALVRDGGGRATTGGPLLGGGQAGVRLGYALLPRVETVVRLSSPLAGRGREAALGVEWRPTRLPVRLVAETRVAIDGGGGIAPVVGAIGGFGPTPVAAGFRLEAYAQGGAIARRGVSGFVDAQARLAHPLTDLGGVRIDLGAGSWASAQRGAARLDVGPTIGVALPVAGRTLRLSLDWRQRIAGDARPASGPALTIGTDF